MKLALGILIFFLAMVAFFFAFHPNPNSDSKDTGMYKNPSDVLKDMITAFGDISGTNATAAPALSPDPGTAPAGDTDPNATPE